MLRYWVGCILLFLSAYLTEFLFICSSEEMERGVLYKLSYSMERVGSVTDADGEGGFFSFLDVHTHKLTRNQHFSFVLYILLSMGTRGLVP